MLISQAKRLLAQSFMLLVLVSHPILSIGMRHIRNSVMLHVLWHICKFPLARRVFYQETSVIRARSAAVQA
jgi:hypothetical protein